MLKEETVNALNEQMMKEFYSSYLYLSMSGHFEQIGLKGFAHWMFVQYQEETDHALKFFNYLKSQGSKIKLMEIKEPEHEWSSILMVFNETLNHEQYVTSCINDLVDISEKSKDRATWNFLQWFVDEQIEEEENVRNVIDQLNLIGDNKSALFLLDKEIGQRIYVPLAAGQTGK
ncbi:MAG: ferritin [Epsilonproteobacteria bacterium]|nr:ferritin [Campylobacterota bacterium]